MISRRRMMALSVVALMGVAAAPLLPARRSHTAGDLLKPELARANPQLFRQLCLEFYDHPKFDYRLAAAVHMSQFKDSAIQQVILNRIALEPRADIKQALVASLVQHQDPSTFPHLARIYWADTSTRATIDQHATFLDMSSLQSVITQSKP